MMTTTTNVPEKQGLMHRFLSAAETTAENAERVEGAVVDMGTMVSPWLILLAPASLSYFSMATHLAFNPILAFLIAAGLEITGVTFISTRQAFIRHNARFANEPARKIETKYVTLGFVNYFAVVLILNVVLGIADIVTTAAAAGASPFTMVYATAWLLVSAKALLIFLTLSAAIVMAARAEYRRLTAEIHREEAKAQAEKDRAKAERAAKRAADSEAKRREKELALQVKLEAERAKAANATQTRAPARVTWPSLKRETPQDAKLCYYLTPAEIQDIYGMADAKTAETWPDLAKRDFGRDPLNLSVGQSAGKAAIQGYLAGLQQNGHHADDDPLAQAEAEFALYPTQN